MSGKFFRVSRVYKLLSSGSRRPKTRTAPDMVRAQHTLMPLPGSAALSDQVASSRPVGRNSSYDWEVFARE
jgi:hypothetical protein